MRFPTMMGHFLCDKSTSYATDSLINTLQHNMSLNARISSVASNEFSFNVYPTFFLERNAFLPNVHVVVVPNDGGSICVFEYSLKKETKILFVIYVVIALIFETLLLLYFKHLSSPLLLLIPLGLIVFAAVMTFCGLYVSSTQIQSVCLSSFNISSKNPLKIVFCSKKQLESSYEQH